MNRLDKEIIILTEFHHILLKKYLYICFFLDFFFTVLSQLPLPTPLSHTVHNKSLLDTPNVVEDARRLLATSDDVLGVQLNSALRHTTTNKMCVF